MVPLKTNRRVLTWFCVCPPDERATKWNRYAYVAFTASSFLVMFSAVLSDALFFWKFIATDIEHSLMALLQLFGHGAMAYSILFMYILRDNINAIFESLSEICAMSKKLSHLLGYKSEETAVVFFFSHFIEPSKIFKRKMCFKN